MFDLTGKTALVTGASGGIGGAIARALHARGATVALSGTRVEALQGLAAELGERTHAIACNLGDVAATEKLVGEAEAAMGKLDILVNNAGLTRDTLAVRMKDEDWQQVLDVDLTAGFRLARAALRGMMKRRFGRIIGITSERPSIDYYHTGLIAFGRNGELRMRHASLSHGRVVEETMAAFAVANPVRYVTLLRAAETTPVVERP